MKTLSITPHPTCICMRVQYALFTMPIYTHIYIKCELALLNNKLAADRLPRAWFFKSVSTSWPRHTASGKTDQSEGQPVLRYK